MKHRMPNRAAFVLLAGLPGAACTIGPGDEPEAFEERHVPDGGPIIDDGGLAIDDELPAASDFSCDQLAEAPQLCVDFNGGDAPGLRVERGTFEVVSGRLVGTGPDATPSVCNEAIWSHALFEGLSQQDVRISMQLAAVQRVDKAIVLRSTDERNRLQLNFRAHDQEGHYGDLMVEEVRDCVYTLLTTEGEIPIFDQEDQAIDVTVELIGVHLVVHVDGVLVADRDLPVRVVSGEVGFGVIDRSRAVFDDVVIDAMEPAN